jgi:hypothetical protein
MAGQFPQLPERLRNILEGTVPGLYAWIVDITRFFNVGITTQGDMTFSTAGKGIVLKNAAGTIIKRVRLNDAGNGLIYEDP